MAEATAKLSGLTADGRRDEFFYLCAINRASLVTNVESGLLTPEQAKKFAPAIAQVTKKGEEDPAERTDRVIKLEPKLIAIAGPEITELHIGRSSQDMHSTYRVAILRDDILDVYKALNALLDEFAAKAREHRAVVVPNYTNGVAAQPNSLGHYLLGISETLVRERTRLEELYARADRCSMGGTVLNGTGWPLDRRAMAKRLGFDGIYENAFDATQGAPVYLPVEFAQIMQSIALPIAAFIQDVLVQYAQPRPWIILEEGEGNTYVSSAMPQKRNPGLLNNTRTLASSVAAGAVEMAFLAHNLVPGMQDPKNVSYRHNIAVKTENLLAMALRILKALKVNPARALEELNSDWTATQEIADELMKNHGVPFRIGHHVASAMVSYARANGLTPLTFPYEKMKEVFKDVTAKEWREEELPMSEEEFHKCLDPEGIVQRRKTEGGPQPESMDRLLEARDDEDAAARAWVGAREKAVLDALTNLEAEFNRYL